MLRLVCSELRQLRARESGLPAWSLTRAAEIAMNHGLRSAGPRLAKATFCCAVNIAAEGIVKERLVRITRIPLVLVAMWIAFAEIARGPALLGSDLYRGVPPETGVGWQDRLDSDEDDWAASGSSSPVIISTSWNVSEPSGSFEPAIESAPADGEVVRSTKAGSTSKWSDWMRDLHDMHGLAHDDAIEPLFAFQLEAATP